MRLAFLSSWKLQHQAGCMSEESLERCDGDSGSERVWLRNRGDDPCLIDPQVIESAPESPRDHRSRGGLALDGDPPAASLQDEIDLRPGRGSIERGLPPGESGDGVFDHQSLPRCAVSRMPQQIVEAVDLEQAVENARVPQIDLRRLDHPFLRVGCKRLQETHHEGLGEQIEIRADRGVAHSQSSSEHRAVERLSVDVGQHAPQAMQRGGRDIEAELGDVALEECSGEALPPCSAARLAGSEEAGGKASAEPETGKHARLVHGNLARQKGRQLQVGDSAGQRLGSLPEEVARGGAQKQELAMAPLFVDQAAEQRKDLRNSLDLVEAEKRGCTRRSLQAEEELGLAQLAEVRRPLQVQVDNARTAANRLTNESGLAALARPQDRDHREIRQASRDLPLDRAGDVTLHIESVACNLQGCKPLAGSLLTRQAQRLGHEPFAIMNASRLKSRLWSGRISGMVPDSLACSSTPRLPTTSMPFSFATLRARRSSASKKSAWSRL